MTDIVERLRSQDPNGLSILLSIQEAAAEIERLRKALQEIAREQSAKDALTAADRFQQIARRALEPKP